MQFLIKLEAGIPVGNPFLAENIKQANEAVNALNKSFLFSSDVTPLGYGIFTHVTKPELDSVVEEYIESTPTTQNGDGEWLQKWVLTPIVYGLIVDKTAAIAAHLARLKAAFITQIDTDADALIRAVIGERASQYEGAERDSLAYKAAGYTGTVPPKVQAWAAAKAQTATWAADSQIATAEDWRSAENALYAKRLLMKETARAAATAAALDDIKTQWTDFMAALRLQLGVA